MKYKPSRDIPLAVREIRTISPSALANWIKNNRTKKNKTTKKREQVVKTPQSINVWFNRHPKIFAELKREISLEEIRQDTVTEALFQNGTFREIPIIKTWIMDLVNRNAKDNSINSFLNYVKRICLGRIGRKEFLEGWGLKHPSQLTIEDAQKFIYEMKQRKLNSRMCAISIRNFFRSRGMTQRDIDKISGALEEAGKYAHLYASKDKIYEIFDYLYPLNFDAYLSSKFAYKTAARITATLSATASYMNKTEHTVIVFEKASKGKAKRKMEKLIPDDLWEELPKTGKLFNITAPEINALLRAAYKEVIPDLAKIIPMPFHFWRHQFAQHMLRATGWNYGIVASLGGWTMNVLRKYYGMPPKDVIRKAGMETLPNI